MVRNQRKEKTEKEEEKIKRVVVALYRNKSVIRWVTEGLETFGGLAKGRVCLGIETVDGGRLFHSLFLHSLEFPVQWNWFWMAFFLGLVERVLKRGRGEGVYSTPDR